MLHVNKRIKDSELCWKIKSLLHDNWMSRRGLFLTQSKSKASSSVVLNKLDNFVHDKMANSPEEMYSSRLLQASSRTSFILLLVALSPFHNHKLDFSIFGPACSLSPCAQYMLSIIPALPVSRYFLYRRLVHL